MRTRHGFTLIELLAVITTIILLVSLLVTAGSYARKIVMIKATENTITALCAAASDYSSDYNGHYPPSYVKADTTTSTEELSGKCGIQALCSYLFHLDQAPKVIRGKPLYYAEGKDFRNDFAWYKGLFVDHIRDAWSVPLFYYNPGTEARNADTYDLFSAGPDMKTNYSPALTLGTIKTGHPGEFINVSPISGDAKYGLDDIGNW
jgi:type II secretory pathway pseudopilin PulG